MKKNYLLFLLCILLAMPGLAQVPTYSNQAGGIANAFPLNSLSTQRRVQWLIPAQSLGTLNAVCMITQVWFQAGSTATQTYPLLNVKLRSGTGMTGLNGAVMEPSMVTVYSGTNYVMSVNASSWFTFTLQTPFLYDPNDPLIVEMEHNATSGSGPSIYQTAITATAPTRQYADYNNNTTTGSDATRRINFGIEVVPACNISISSSASGTNNAAICSGSSLTLTTNAVSGYSWSNGAITPSIVVNPTLNTVYSLTATSSASCVASRSYSVNVSSAAPVLTVTASSGSVCLGAVASITASGALTYTLSNGASNGATFAPTSTAVYTVTGQNGCGVTSATTSILVGPLPVQITAASPTTCAGSSVSFSVNAVANYYTWTPQNIVTSSSVTALTPTATTIYTVTVTDGTCSGTATVNLIAHPLPTLSIASTGSDVCQGTAITMTASGGNNYTWTPSSLSGAVVTDSPTANILYQVASSNAFGCVGMTSLPAVIKYPPNMNTSFTSTNVCVNKVLPLSASGAGSYTWSTGSNSASISYTASSSAIVTVTGGHTLNACVVSKQFSVNAVTPPLPVTAGTAICLGSAASLTAGSGTGYNWSPYGGNFSGATVSPTLTTVFTVTANVLSSNIVCPAQNTVLVTVNALPTVSATANSTSICKSQPLNITASGANTYTWSNLAQSTSITFSSTQVTTHTIQVSGTDASGCTNSTSIAVKVNACTGIEESDLTSQVLVYPVPASGEITISSTKPMQLELLNELGQVIRKISLSQENNGKIILNDLSPGIYILQGDSGILIRKVVIE